MLLFKKRNFPAPDGRGQKVRFSGFIKLELEFRDIESIAMDYGFSKQNIIRRFDALIYFETSTPSRCFRQGEK